MSLLAVVLAAFFVSVLTFFSGFGLGTLLLPVFAVFFPIEVAVAATAIVHLANNLFKLLLVGRAMDRATVFRFAAPAVPAAVLGAWILNRLSNMSPWFQYTLAGQIHGVTPIKMVIGLLMLCFAVLEMWPSFKGLSFPGWAVPWGGVLSGFFGGLSGHQGAFRSAFLIRVGLSKEAFIGTGIICAVTVDFARLAVYGLSQLGGHVAEMASGDQAGPVVAGMTAAFIGSWIGSRVLHNVSMRMIHQGVAVFLLLIGLLLAAGLV